MWVNKKKNDYHRITQFHQIFLAHAISYVLIIMISISVLFEKKRTVSFLENNMTLLPILLKESDRTIVIIYQSHSIYPHCTDKDPIDAHAMRTQYLTSNKK